MDNKVKSFLFKLPEKTDYMTFKFCLIVKQYNVHYHLTEQAFKVSHAQT